MPIENGWTSTIEAQRVALDQRQDIINSLLDDNIELERKIMVLTETIDVQGNEIKGLNHQREAAIKSMLEIIGKL